MDRISSALEQISAEDFEDIVAYYLRRTNPRLATLIQTGVNAKGDFVAYPVDGLFIHKHNSIAFAATTTARQELTRKWLGGGRSSNYRKGDIEKFAELLENKGLSSKDEKPLLYLAINLSLGSDSDTNLKNDAIACGDKYGIDIEFIEASILVDFLNNSAAGQYIAQTVLGIDADWLGEDLLREIAAASLSQHRFTFGIGSKNKAREITRDVHSDITHLLQDSNTSVICLRGVSGSGKSTLARQVCELMLDSGRVALWVPAELITPHTTIASTLHKVLHNHQPHLGPRAAENAVGLASQLPGGIVILVDDINRVAHPDEVLRVLRLWSRRDDEPGETIQPASPSAEANFRFIVPLWPTQEIGDARQLQAGAKNELPKGWAPVELTVFSGDERVAFAQDFSASSLPDALQVVDALDGDPLFCGLAAEMTGNLHWTNRAIVIRDIFENVIARAIKESCDRTKTSATQGEYKAAIDALLGMMLRDISPAPEWLQVRSSLGNRPGDLLYDISETNILGWIDTQNGIEYWRWKHARIQQAMLGRWLAQKVASVLEAGDMDAHLIRWLNDAGLAEAWAMALVFLPASVQPEKLVNVLAEYQPLALAEALSFNLFTDNPRLSILIAELLAKCLASYTGKSYDFVGGPRNVILSLLSHTDNPYVLTALNGIAEDFWVLEARLRNGDILAGITWINQHKDFVPYSQYPSLELAIEAFARVTVSHRKEVATQIREALADDKFLYASIQFAGYLAWPELAQHVWYAWTSSTMLEEAKLKMLDGVVWTLARCGDESLRPELEEALLLVRNVPAQDERNHNDSNNRYWTFEHPMEFAARWAISEWSIEVYCKVASEYPELCETLVSIIRGIDHPIAMDFYARHIAQHGPPLGLFGEPVDPLAQVTRDPKFGHYDSKPLVPSSPASREHLWKMVVEEDDEAVRTNAFRLWKFHLARNDLELLQSITPGDPLFEHALKARLLLRDGTAHPFLVERILNGPDDGWFSWHRFAPLIYDAPGVREAFRVSLPKILGKDEGYTSAAALQHLPGSELEELAVIERERLLSASESWFPLWRSQVPGAVRLVQEALADETREIPRYFFTEGGFPFTVSLPMLDALVPYLHRFNDDDLDDILELAIRNGYRQWAKEHLTSKYQAALEKYGTDIESVLSALTAAVNKVEEGPQAVDGSNRLFHFLDFYEDEPRFEVEGLLEITKEWVGPEPTPSRIVIAGKIVAAKGTAEDSAWWESLRPNEAVAHTVWANALYFLERQRWSSI